MGRKKKRFSWSGVDRSSTGKTWTCQCEMCEWRAIEFPTADAAAAAYTVHCAREIHRERKQTQSLIDRIAAGISPAAS